MSLPDPDYFTHVELAERWKNVYGDCTPDLVIRYITTGKLKGEKKTITRLFGGGINWVTQQPSKSRVQTIKEWYEIPLAEILRFEAEHPPIQDTAAPAIETAPPQGLRDKEKPADYADRRRNEGATDPQIAKELRENGCHFSAIGRTLHPDPPVENSAYQKRGKKLVKSAD